MTAMELIKRDSQVTWHPFTQAKTELEPLPIVRAQGVNLYTESGEVYLDAISSWWVNLHGHCHPKVSSRVSKTLTELDQVIFAGCTHSPAVELAERLLKRMPTGHTRLFFSDNGSTAVEVAIKMAMQYWENLGQERPILLALNDAYHGDTFGAMSVGARGVFTAPFNSKLFSVVHIDVKQGSSALSGVRNDLENKKVAGIIYEPLVQGAAGMLMHRAQDLSVILEEVRRCGGLLIADEVMTGFGRTGKFLASEHLTLKPDLICLSKGITNGLLPLGVTSATEEIYQAFYSDTRLKMFLHGHSFTANPIACSAALGNLDIFDTEDVFGSINRINANHARFINDIKGHHAVEDARLCGTIAAINIKTDSYTGYANSIRQTLYSKALRQGILLRPLGNVLYVLPPYVISDEELSRAYNAIFSIVDELS